MWSLFPQSPLASHCQRKIIFLWCQMMNFTWVMENLAYLLWRIRTPNYWPANWVSVGVDVASQNINKSLPSLIKAQLSLTLQEAGGNFRARTKREKCHQAQSAAEGEGPKAAWAGVTRRRCWSRMSFSEVPEVLLRASPSTRYCMYCKLYILISKMHFRFENLEMHTQVSFYTH